MADSAFTNPEVEAGLFQALADFDPDTLVAQAENAMSGAGLRLKCKCLGGRAVLAKVRPNVGQRLERLIFEFAKLVKFPNYLILRSQKLKNENIFTGKNISVLFVVIC